MATVAELLNKGKCHSETFGNALGAETSKGCATLITAAKSIIAIAPGAEIKKDAELYSEIDRLILDGKMEILRGVQNFEQNGSDDATETLPDDTMRVTNEGKYAFTASFTNGLFFNKALHSLKGYKRWNILLVDANGIYGVETETGLAGFSTGMFQPVKLTFPSPTSGQQEGIRFQLLNRYELDEDYGFIMDSGIRKLKGITELKLALVNEPLASDTTLTAKVVLAMDESVVYEGATFADFALNVNGVSQDPTAGDDSATAGTYVLTVPALAAEDELVLRMPIHKGPDGDYYKASGVSYSIPA